MLSVSAPLVQYTQKHNDKRNSSYCETTLLVVFYTLNVQLTMASSSSSSAAQAGTAETATNIASVVAVENFQDGKTNTNTNVYETDDSLHMYLGLHYPKSGIEDGIEPILSHERVPNQCLRFPQRVAELLVKLIKDHDGNFHKGLDIGCAVGGSSFELAKHFDNVSAFDYSAKFIHAANQMKQQGRENRNNEDEMVEKEKKIKFRIPIEAEVYKEVEAIHDDGVDSEVCSKVNFFVGNACNMKNMQSSRILDLSYDGVIMANLLCRLTDPVTCLNDLSSIVKPGGIVVIVTPYSWLSEYTPKNKWLGGYYSSSNKKRDKDGNTKAIYSKDVLKQIMETNGFIKIHEEQMPLMIREHRRKYQYIISEATGWQRPKK